MFLSCYPGLVSCGDQDVSPRLSLNPLTPTLDSELLILHCSARPSLAALIACGQLGAMPSLVQEY